ncbi:MAG: ABC transporter ATP-binding protein [Candidatus Cloacimonetes bacterium 4572_65]|nr:MAG: ABC transporter ATP-binding protein [Candidatus Cloacimonetes bacterium 4572_65]
MIKVQNLTKEFSQKDGEKFLAVDDLSFSVDKGEIVCLLGVNGAGKTTTMRILSTVFKPTSGTALIEGFDIIENGADVRRNLGFLSGDTGLYTRLKSREFLRYFGDLYGLPRSETDRKIKEMADLLDMNSFLDKKIDFLSTGMRQKVSIVRSIIHNPPVMILDEPTSGLDILTARNIVSFINRSKDDGKSVLFSTHIMREAERLADKIVMVHKGKLLAEGGLEQLRDDTHMKDLDDIFVYYVDKDFAEHGGDIHEF